MTRRLALGIGLALVACVVPARGGQPPSSPPPGGSPPAAQAPAADAWQTFDGSFTATGRRDTVPREDGGVASTVRLTGSLVITAGSGLRRGFRVEALGFEDGSGPGMGRAVWTDDRGDRIFSRMVGASIETGRRSAATITGGTGQYAGLSGTYTFTWQYVMPGEEHLIHARTNSLSGRFRKAPAR